MRYRNTANEKIPIDKNVIRQPTCSPIIRPRGIPRIIATEVPVTIILSAKGRWFWGTRLTAKGETIDQKIECVHAPLYAKTSAYYRWKKAMTILEKAQNKLLPTT